MVTNLVLEKPYDYGITDYDGLWKKLIHELFEEFILFFAPSLTDKIDFAKGPEFLEQELFQEIINEKKGKNVADQVIKVFLKDGEEKWILLHIEIEGSGNMNFPKRMFRYYYRIYDKFDKDILAIAILTDDKKHFRPDSYHKSFHGTSITYTYNMYKISDYAEHTLLESSNPFAIAVLAAKYVHETKDNDERRYQFKYKLMKTLLQKGNYPQEERRIYIAALIYFIDYLLQIPLELTKKLREEIILTKEAKEMAYIDRENLPISWGELEKVFRDEGRQEGRQEGKQEGIKEGEQKAKKSVAFELLKDGMSVEQVAKYAKLSVEEVQEIIKTEQ